MPPDLQPSRGIWWVRLTSGDKLLGLSAEAPGWAQSRLEQQTLPRSLGADKAGTLNPPFTVMLTKEQGHFTPRSSSDGDGAQKKRNELRKICFCLGSLRCQGHSYLPPPQKNKLFNHIYFHDITHLCPYLHFDVLKRHSRHLRWQLFIVSVVIQGLSQLLRHTTSIGTELKKCSPKLLWKENILPVPLAL